MTGMRTTPPAGRPADTTQAADTVRPDVRWVIDFDAKREPMFADEQGGGWVPIARLNEVEDALAAAARRTEQAEARADELEAAVDALGSTLAPALARVRDLERWNNALDLAAGYYRRNLREIIGHTSDDNLELATTKIRVHAEEAIRAADGALAAALVSGAAGGNSDE